MLYFFLNIGIDVSLYICSNDSLVENSGKLYNKYSTRNSIYFLLSLLACFNKCPCI